LLYDIFWRMRLFVCLSPKRTLGIFAWWIVSFFEYTCLLNIRSSESLLKMWKCIFFFDATLSIVVFVHWYCSLIISNKNLQINPFCNNFAIWYLLKNEIVCMLVTQKNSWYFCLRLLYKKNLHDNIPHTIFSATYQQRLFK
jgi:hypothetical protein